MAWYTRVYLAPARHMIIAAQIIARVACWDVSASTPTAHRVERNDRRVNPRSQKEQSRGQPTTALRFHAGP